MNDRAPLSPARLGEPTAPGLAPSAPDFGDTYHPGTDAWAQAQHVFLAGNGLPSRWQGRHHFVILETGFGLGNNFLATWSAWRNDPQRCDRLTFISIEKHPLRQGDLAEVHGLAAPHCDEGLSDREAHRQALARKLHDLWPPLTPGWHHLMVDAQRGPLGQSQHVHLMLGLGDIGDLLPSLMASVDAFYLDGFKPTANPEMWAPELLSRLNRLAAPNATAATWSSARMVRDALSAAQFEVRKVPGLGGKFHTTEARFTPRFTPPAPAGGLWPPTPTEHQHALVIGAGLAGCSATWSLARQGWRVTLLDAAPGPAQGASGNPGGLFHSIVHGDDGLHARAHRAAALATWARVHAAISRGDLPGQCQGLLRLDARQDTASAQALLTRQPWLAQQARWLTQTEAQALAGIPVPSGGWHFLQAGWLQPGAYARWLLAEAHQQGSDAVKTHWSCSVARIQRDEARGLWQALDADHQLLAEAPSLVLANAWQAQRLLDTLPPNQATAPWPMSAVRGQITWLPAVGSPEAPPHIALPHLPVAGSGYVLTLPGGRLLCGATTQHHDHDTTLRATDHAHNLQQAHRLGAWSGVASEAAADAADDAKGGMDSQHLRHLEGRVGWRATTPDRLPLIGVLPWHADRLANVKHLRREQVRMLPRERQMVDGRTQGSLSVIGGLGSRGITWAALAGELLAHWVTGAPCPVEAELRDAMDPARFLARQQRQ